MQKRTKKHFGSQEVETQNDESNKFQKTSMHASWRFMNPRDNVWSPLHQRNHEDLIVERESYSLSHHNFVQKFNPMRFPDAKTTVDKE